MSRQSLRVLRPRNYWMDATNHKVFMKALEKKLGISEWREWYQVTQKEIIDFGGTSLLGYYNNSPSDLIMRTLPQHPWNILHFKCVPMNYWTKETNQQVFMKNLEKKLNISDWKDWYQVTKSEIKKFGGRSLLAQYNDSPSKLIMNTYSEHSWDLISFKTVPRNYWSVGSNRREFMNTLEEKLNIIDWKDWYQVTAREISDKGGAYLLAQYDFSPSKLIISMLPQHPWNLFEFRSVITWNPQMIQNFLSHIASSLQIYSASAWRTLSTVQIQSFPGGGSLLRQTGSLYEALKSAHPALEWNFMKTVKISRPQNSILEILRAYIPRDTILVNFRHPSLIHKSGVTAELDIWIPSLNLALEYQGEHHFHQLWERSQHPSTRKKRDAEKRSLCEEKGIDLVEIPYWWDKSVEQLVGIIRGVQPMFLKDVESLADLAPIQQPTLRERGNITINMHSGVEYSPISSNSDLWHVSEKLDGIRFHWDGVQVFSRGGRPIELLGPVSTPLFDHIVDGELWYGRGLRFGHGAIQQPELLAFDAFYLESTQEDSYIELGGGVSK